MSSTDALVVFGATGIDAFQETVWYGIYGLTLWIAVVIVVRVCGPELMAPTVSRTRH